MPAQETKKCTKYAVKKNTKIHPAGVDSSPLDDILSTYPIAIEDAHSGETRKPKVRDEPPQHPDEGCIWFRHSFIFPQAHWLRVTWDGIIVVSLLYIILILPLEFTYENPSGGGWDVLGKMVDIVFWSDILVCFRTTYVNNQGETIYDGVKIAEFYIKDFFFIDFFCCLPGYPLNTLIDDLISSDSKGAGSVTAMKLGKAPRILRVVRSVKLIKVLRVLKVMSFLEEMRDSFPASMVLYKMFKLLIFTSFFLHVNACCFSSVAASQDYGDSWTHLIVFEGWWDEYISALYWSTTTSTTVGYGDITPVSTSEKGFCIISMALGVGVYGYIIGSMTEVVTSMSFVDHQLQERMDQIHEFIKRHEFPPDTRKGLLKFYRNHFKKKRYVNEKDIMELLPSKLLGLVRDCVCSEGFRKIHIVRCVETRFFPRVVNLLSPRTCLAGEEIIATEGDLNPTFFFAIEGHVSIFQPIFKGPFSGNQGVTRAERRILCMEKVEALHAFYDKNHDGSIDITELQTLLSGLLTQPASVKDTEKAMTAMDVDGSQTVNLQEFVDWFVRTQVETLDNQDLCDPIGNISLWRPFGLYSAFNLGMGQRNPYKYVCMDVGEMMSICAVELILEFEDDENVLRIVEDTLVGPARMLGMKVDQASDKKWNDLVEEFTKRDFHERENGKALRNLLFDTTIHASREPYKAMYADLRRGGEDDDDKAAEQTEDPLLSPIASKIVMGDALQRHPTGPSEGASVFGHCNKCGHSTRVDAVPASVTVRRPPTPKAHPKTVRAEHLETRALLQNFITLCNKRHENILVEIAKMNQSSAQVHPSRGPSSRTPSPMMIVKR